MQFDWISLSLIAPSFWAMSNIIDQFLIRSSFQTSPLFYVAIQGAFYLPLLLLFGFFVPEILAVAPADAVILIMISVTWIPAVLCYVLALKGEDASIAVPLFNLAPVLVLLGGWLFLHETISMRQLAGGLIILAGATAILWDFHRKRLKGRTLILMLTTCVCFSAYNLAARHMSGHLHWTQIYFWYGAGYSSLSMALLMLYKPLRSNLPDLLKMPKKAIFLSGLQSWLDIAASSSMTAALAIAPAASMVSFLMSVQPIYVFILTGLFALFLPRYFEGMRMDKACLWKLFCILVIISGVFMLLTNDQ